MGFEFLGAAEQLGATGPALVDAFGLGVGVLAGEGPLGAGLAQHGEFVGGELLTPLVVGEFHPGPRRGHVPTLAQTAGADFCHVRRGVALPASERQPCQGTPRAEI